MPKFRKKPVEGDVSIYITCIKCGWKWRPMPRKWRNKANMVRERTLSCPSCGRKNRISLEDVKRIWNHNYKL